jgi:putative protease
VTLEAFAHGAMCMSYSGRCLLSNYLTGRKSNKGECSQPCRWEYEIGKMDGGGERYPIEQDKRGSYILSSRDLNMLPYIDKLHHSGIKSLKIEGRQKSAYYLATVVNAYRRAIDGYTKTAPAYKPDERLLREPEKTSHRGFTTGFYFGADTEMSGGVAAAQTHTVAAEVLSYDKKSQTALVEQRNKFAAGDTLEILSPDENFLKTFTAEAMTDERGAAVAVADTVQAKLRLRCPYSLKEKDILRRRQAPAGK